MMVIMMTLKMMMMMVTIDDVDDNERFQEDCRANRVWEAWEAAAQINQALRK